MPEWERVSLGEILEQDVNYVAEPEPRIYSKVSVKLYGRGVTPDTPVNGADLKMKRHQLAEAGQVILSEIWGKKGAIGLVPLEGSGALCTSHFFLFDIDHTRVIPGWLELIFKANYLEKQLNSGAQGTTGYAAVRPKHLQAAEIPLPPLPEQRRIIARVKELLDKVEEAQGLRDEIRKITEHLTNLTGDSKFIIGQGELLGDLVDIIDPNPSHRYPEYTEEGVHIISTTNFVGLDDIESTSAKKVPRSFFEETLGKFNPSSEDIIFARKGKIGYARRYPSASRLAMTHTLCLIKIKSSKLDSSYLLHLLRSREFIRYLLETMNDNTGVPTLGLGVQYRTTRFQ
ncbi:restriction endonuclease subunit S [Deinococcus marmoris]|uniref:restriction endonuclease subunit S n=1 Tax=Deinococcus marmoris TaxID=249408 RepID=UPI0009DE8A9A|nr:restriction endonuclease subunit S [Deinococcus marmoris]